MSPGTESIMASLSLRHIYKKYPGGVTAVSDFCLEVRDTEFIIFVGPSGCGKSTTLRMIAGLEEITEGELYIGDRLVNDVAPKDRDIAMVFQNYALYPHMTVFDNMAFGLKLPRFRRKKSSARLKKPQEFLIFLTCLTDTLRLFPVVRSSVLRSVVQSFVTPRYSFSTSRSQTLTQSSARQ